jgi:hypothetical protein
MILQSSHVVFDLQTLYKHYFIHFLAVLRAASNIQPAEQSSSLHSQAPCRESSWTPAYQTKT